MTIGLPGAPEPLGHKRPFQDEPAFRRILSPGENVVALILPSVHQAEVSEVPSLASSPAVESR